MEAVQTPMLEQLQNCHHRLNIEFSDLGYSVTQSKGRKSAHQTILKGISGTFKSGRLTAILGASGAGKSTLLNVLSGFRMHGVTGTILINGQERNVSQFRKSSCYITQEIAMMSYLTAEETLMTAADLKLGIGIAKERKKSLVNEVLQLLGLFKAKKTLVGKLSGGEQKRLSIGVELLTNPPVMFFDEPTSGLDSVSSLLMITYLKSLAQSGRTVICSIHQPSSRLFEMFDDIYLLAEGECLYTGPLDELTTVLEEEGFKCPNYYNRADFAIEVACKERGNNTDKLISRFKKKYLNFEEIETSEVVDREEQGMRDTVIAIAKVENSKELYEYTAPFYFQLYVLTKRAMICTYRDLHLGLVRFFTHLIVGILLGVMCYDIGNEASKAHTNAATIFFFVLFLFTLSPLLTVLSFPMEASVFLKEHHNNWYSLKAYFIGKLFSDLPLQIICSTVFIVVSYYLTGQPYDSMRSFKFWLLCILLSVCGQSLGFTAGAAFDAQMGLFVVIAFSIPMVLFSGFYMRLNDIVSYLQWLSHMSYYRFGFEGGLLIVYTDRPKLHCSVPYCHFKNPSKLLEEYGMENASLQNNFISIVIWIFVFQILFFIVLKWRVYKSR